MKLFRAAFFALMLLAPVACSKHEAARETRAVTVTGVVVDTVKAANLPEQLEVTGTVRSRTAAVVSPRVPGMIAVLKVKEGDRVKKGALLAVLDARENLANADAAGSATEEAKRAVDEAVARKNLAVTQFERYKNLFKSDVVSRQEFEVKETEKELALQGVARAQARLKQAQEQAKSAGAMADYTRMTAPIAGIITARTADLGATVFPGQPVFTLEDESGYQLELAVPESAVAKVRPGTPVTVTLDAVAGTVATTIAEIVPSADPASRTFTAKVPLAMKGLKSGMFGKGAIPVGAAVERISVAKKSIVERGAITYLWVIDSANIARLRIVKTGRSSADLTEITSGIAAGEKIAVSGLDKLLEGAKVE
ncbi:MAG: efflux RND transporter periplasmic adaptor subunit [Geobacter sp.]|nr:efflux RND transporter periplasmic adaptor subunit [Geobacter sp.]